MSIDLEKMKLTGNVRYLGTIDIKELEGKEAYFHAGSSRYWFTTLPNLQKAEVWEDITWEDLEVGNVYDISRRSGWHSYSLVKKNVLLEPDSAGLNIIDLEPLVKQFLDGAKNFKKGMMPKLGILNAGPAGTGKTHNINKVVKNLLGENGVALYYGMDHMRTSDLISFLRGLRRPKNIDKLFLTIEDLGGGEADDRRAMMWGSDSSLLGLLDGNLLPWKDVPTVIMSTTNHKRNFMANIIDRPGRFDEVYDFDYPSGEAVAKYIEHLIERPLTDFDRRAIEPGKLSVAHARLAAVKFLVYDIPIHTTIEKMRKHTADIEKKAEVKLGPKVD